MNSKIFCKCKIDGYEWMAFPTNLLRGNGCPICAGKRALKGYNDMWTTNPELAKLLADPEDGYKYTQSSGQKVNWKCPTCKNIIKNKRIADIHNQGLSCPKCSDGISYPEKFMYNLLLQLNIKFEYQYRPKWCEYYFKGKQKYGIYDFYIPFKQIIIEMDGGLGHGNKSYAYEINSVDSKFFDNQKDILAYQNDIEIIRVDCYYDKQKILNNFQYIKRSVLNNKKFCRYFELSNVNWNDIDYKSNQSIIEQVCLYKKQNNNLSTFDLSHITGLSHVTVGKYLKIGNRLGMCNYDAKIEQLRAIHKSKNCKKVICLNTNETYNSAVEASKKYNIMRESITNCCLRKSKSAGKLSDGTKLHWMYFDEYFRLKGEV